MKHHIPNRPDITALVGDRIITKDGQKGIILSFYGDNESFQYITQDKRLVSAAVKDVLFYGCSYSDKDSQFAALFGGLLNLNEETKTLNAANKLNKVSCCFADAVFARNQAIIDEAFKFLQFGD